MTRVQRHHELMKLIYERAKRKLDCEVLFKEIHALDAELTPEERHQLSEDAIQEWRIWAKYAEPSTFHRMNGESFRSVNLSDGPRSLPSEEIAGYLPASSLSPWFRVS